MGNRSPEEIIKSDEFIQHIFMRIYYMLSNFLNSRDIALINLRNR